MKINVKCLYSFIQTQGRKGKLHFARIMFKHSLAASAILKRHFWEAVLNSVTAITGNILFTELPEIVPFTFGEKPINQGEFAQLNSGPTKLWPN